MNQPLVSVPVITYNSSAYIIDGLESIKAQTYQNIELIISDDCSTDNTVEICRQWLENNKDRFVRTLLVTSDKNTGVAGNCNRSVAPCQGEWIKGLSGDDRFLPHTIQRYVDFVLKHPEADICFAKFHFLTTKNYDISGVINFYERLYTLINQDLRSQKRNIVRQMFVPGPGWFYKKKLWETIGGFDERYPFCEEDPFINRVILGGHRVHFIDEELYGYTLRDDSLSRDTKLLTRHMNDRIAYFFDERKKNMIIHGDIFNAWHDTIMYTAMKSKKHALPIKLLYFTSPIWYRNQIAKLFNKNNEVYYSV